jgi:hypothetical protein
MVEYQCPRCGYTTNHLSSFKNHLQRKNVCAPSVVDVNIDGLLESYTEQTTKSKCYKCDYCDKVFSTPQSKYQHKIRCKKTEVAVLKDQIKTLEKKVSHITNNNNTTNNNTTNNNTTNINNGTVNNIHVHAFSKEDIKHILDHPKFHDAIIHAAKKKRDGMMYLIGKKHFDPAHPENHTIKKLTKKDPFIEVYDGKQWIVRDQEDVLEDVFIGVHNMFSHFVDAYSGDWNKMRTVLDAFMKTVGQPLDWDINSDAYEYDGNMTEKQKEECRIRLFKLAYEYIYRRSGEIFNNKTESI